MKKTILLPSLALLLGASASTAQQDETPVDQSAISRAVAPSLVCVEYTLQFDKGEAPQGAGWTYRCPNCGERHTMRNAEKLVKEQRPYEAAGFLLAPTKVITPDPMIHPRFIKAISVRFGDNSVDARPYAYMTEQTAVILETSGPLEGASPLAFDAAAPPPPYWAVTHAKQNAVWTATVQALPDKLATTVAGRRFRPTPSYCLIVDKLGGPVGMSMDDELPDDDSWKGSPLDWRAIPAAQMAERLADHREASDRTLLRVALSFRSPKQKSGGSRYRFGGDSDEGVTEQNVAGVLLDENRILVLADLKPNVTARLDRIVVHPPQGDPVSAKFVASLADYGGLIAGLETPLPDPLVLSGDDILDFRNKLLMATEVMLQGEKRVAYYAHRRIASFEPRWRRQVFPDVAGNDDHLFLHDADGRLLILPIARREKVSEQERWSSNSPVLLPAVYLKEILADLDKHTDPNNAPLTEEQESRLAWIGVELQALDKELARANNVSDLTKDGETGALVSFVYPDSPAAKAGIDPGSILLRLHVEGEPKPFEIQIEEDAYRFQSFPWDRLDEVPEEYFDRIPTPWPPAENAFTRALTDMGFGKAYTAEFFTDGELVTHEFRIVQSPTHYDTAPKYKSQPLGLTVRDLTFEVRRYFQKADDEPGVVISKIEPGSKVAVAGLKPYEIITHVNDAPVHAAMDFEGLVSDQQELRFAVKRLTRGRIVKIKMTAPIEKKDEKSPDQDR